MVVFGSDLDSGHVFGLAAIKDAQRLLRGCFRPSWFDPQDFFADRLLALSCVESPIEERFVAAFPMAGPNGVFVTFCGLLERTEVQALPPNGNYLIPQFQVQSWRLDFALVRKDSDGNLLAKIAIECDGHEFHERTKDQAARDRKRDRELQHLGWVVLRFTGSEIHRDVYSCCEDAIRHFIRVLGEREPADVLARSEGESAEVEPCAKSALSATKTAAKAATVPQGLFV